jgi:thermitase
MQSVLMVLLLAGCAQPLPLTKTGDDLPQPAVLTTPLSRPIKDNQIVVLMKAGNTLGGYATQAVDQAGTVVVQCKKDEDMAATLEKLNDDPRVELAEPNYIYKISASTNDPLNKQLWGYSAANVFQAWDLGRGSSAIKVAVVDTGVDYRHPDLAGRVIKGHDYINEDSDPMDDHGHGTHCAGVIGAISDNAIGISGIASGVSIIAIKVMDSEGSGPLSAVAAGIQEATRLGANVINLSLGDSSNSAILQSAIAEAVKAGVTVVAAAGNDGTSRKYYPAACPGVISVGALDISDSKADFSNYGDWVKVVAPGVNIVSTMPNSSYAPMSGTSMASPHAAGLAALLLSRYPTLTPAQVLNAIANTGRTARGFAGIKEIDAYAALSSVNSQPNNPTPAPTPTAIPTPAPTIRPTPQPTSYRDYTAPTVPTGLCAVSLNGAVQLTWTPSTDDRGVSSYKVYRNGLRLGSSRETCFVDHDVKSGNSYSYQVSAQDDASNVSDKCSAVSLSFEGSAIRILEVELTALTRSYARIYWLTDLPGSTKIEIRSGSQAKEDVKAKLGRIHLVTLTGLKAGTSYQFRVSATDGQGHTATGEWLSFTAK